MTPERYDALERSGDRLRSSIAGAITQTGLDASIGGIGSLFQVFPGSRLTAPDGLTPQSALFMGLLVDGLHLSPRGMGAIATPATDEDLDDLATAILSRLGSMQAVAIS